MSYTKEQIAAALALLDATGSPDMATKTLGYPSGPMLYKWREKYPEYVSRPSARHCKQAPANIKEQAIQRCLSGGEPVQSVSRDIGYSESIIYKWVRVYRKKGLISVMKKPGAKKASNVDPPDSIESIEELKAQILDMQMDIDILKEAIGILKKGPGIDPTTLKNREKAVIIDAMRNKHSLPKLLGKMPMSRSSYYYQAAVLKADDKYRELRAHIIELFQNNRGAYGYRKIHTLLNHEGIKVSEKVIRQIMRKEALIARTPKRHKYNSYKGEISAAPDNIIGRNFHSDKPNEKWLTDITEFSIKAGKVYLSPVLDCFDGMPVCWTMGTPPSAGLVNSMLLNAVATLSPGERPIIHSDRGCHYRWPEWISITEKAGLTRSMSAKGCFPGNAACEGFFGHLKTEMFYGHNWDGYSIPGFISVVDSYIKWYCKDRIKSTPGGFSPMQYRKELGVGV